jgi:hypothetical protein
MNASQLIDDLVANLTDWRGTTFANVRKVIHDADPEIIEEWKWMGTPVWSHDGIVCLAKAFNAELTSIQWRAIDIFKDDRINEGSLKILIRSAADYNNTKVKTGNKPSGTRGNVKKKPAK